MAVGVRVAKQQLRQQLREALKGMTSQQMQEESLILVEKVRYLIVNVFDVIKVLFLSKISSFKLLSTNKPEEYQFTLIWHMKWTPVTF